MLFSVCPRTSCTAKFWHMYMIRYGDFMVIVKPSTIKRPSPFPSYATMVYIYSKTMCHPGHHNNGFVAQSHCGDNREGILFSWLHICYAHLAFVRFEHSLCRGITYTHQGFIQAVLLMSLFWSKIEFLNIIKCRWGSQDPLSSARDSYWNLSRGSQGKTSEGQINSLNSLDFMKIEFENSIRRLIFCVV